MALLLEAAGVLPIAKAWLTPGNAKFSSKHPTTARTDTPVMIKQRMALQKFDGVLAVSDCSAARGVLVRCCAPSGPE